MTAGTRPIRTNVSSVNLIYLVRIYYYCGREIVDAC
jgi:hypothetical protein